MIVKHTEHGWNIIFQRAHALLAAQIALQWKADGRPEPWTDLVAAIADHDDGQRDWEGENHLTNAGAPMDFTYQGPDIEQAKRVVDNARYRSRWIAYLTSKHTSTLYEGWRNERKEITRFLDEQQQYQQKLVKDLGVKTTEAELRYRFMFFCDALSLILCKGQVPPDGLKLDIAPLPDGKTASLWQSDESKISVSSWPFESSQFSTEVEVYKLEQLAFKSDHELYEAFDSARITLRKWYFQKAE